MVVWKCSHCGYTLDAEQPPEQCPSCKEKCMFLNVTCYIPDCGAPDPRAVDERLSKKWYSEGPNIIRRLVM